MDVVPFNVGRASVLANLNESAGAVWHRTDEVIIRTKKQDKSEIIVFIDYKIMGMKISNVVD